MHEVNSEFFPTDDVKASRSGGHRTACGQHSHPERAPRVISISFTTPSPHQKSPAESRLPSDDRAKTTDSQTPSVLASSYLFPLYNYLTQRIERKYLLWIATVFHPCGSQGGRNFRSGSISDVLRGIIKTSSSYTDHWKYLCTRVSVLLAPLPNWWVFIMTSCTIIYEFLPLVLLEGWAFQLSTIKQIQSEHTPYHDWDVSESTLKWLHFQPKWQKTQEVLKTALSENSTVYLQKNTVERRSLLSCRRYFYSKYQGERQQICKLIKLPRGQVSPSSYKEAHHLFTRAGGTEASKKTSSWKGLDKFWPQRVRFQLAYQSYIRESHVQVSSEGLSRIK